MSDEQEAEIFSKRLKQARDLRGLSQAQLASKAGLPAASVSHFESGPRKPSFDNLKSLASALDVTTDYLLGRADTPEASATVGKLHRDINKLTSQDLELTKGFVELLISKRKPSGDQG